MKWLVTAMAALLLSGAGAACTDRDLASDRDPKPDLTQPWPRTVDEPIETAVPAEEPEGDLVEPAPDERIGPVPESMEDEAAALDEDGEPALEQDTEQALDDRRAPSDDEGS